MDNPKLSSERAHHEKASPPKPSDSQLEFSAMTRAEIKEALDALSCENLRLVEEARESKAAVDKLTAENENLKALLEAQAAFITRSFHADAKTPAQSSTAAPPHPLLAEHVNEKVDHLTGSQFGATSGAIKRKHAATLSASSGSPAQSSERSLVSGRLSGSSLISLEDNFPNLIARPPARKYEISYGDTPPRNIPAPYAASTSTSTQVSEAVSPYGSWNGGINPFVSPRLNHATGFTGVFRGTNWKETIVNPSELAGNCKSCGIKGHMSMHCPSELGVAPIVGGPNNGLFRKKPYAKEYVTEARCTYDPNGRKVVVLEVDA